MSESTTPSDKEVPGAQPPWAPGNRAYEVAALIGRQVDRHFPGLPMDQVQSFMRETADKILRTWPDV